MDNLFFQKRKKVNIMYHKHYRVLLLNNYFII